MAMREACWFGSSQSLDNANRQRPSTLSGGLSCHANAQLISKVNCLERSLVTYAESELSLDLDNCFPDLFDT